MTPGEHSKAVAMYQDGSTWAEIGEATGLSPSSIAHALRKAGIEPRRHRNEAQIALVEAVARMSTPDPKVYAAQAATIIELSRELGRLEAERDAARELAWMHRTQLVNLNINPSTVPPLPPGWNMEDYDDDIPRPEEEATEQNAK